jgi:hypothetical protein
MASATATATLDDNAHDESEVSDSQAATFAPTFTIKTSLVINNVSKDYHSVSRPFTLPSDDVKWCQLIEGCPTPAEPRDRDDILSPPSQSDHDHSFDLPDLIHLTLKEDSANPSAPKSSYYYPSIKSSYLHLDTYIGSGRLYHAFRGTLTRHYDDHKISPSMLPVVVKYVALDDFEEEVNRTANNGEHANEYDQDQVAAHFANEVDLLLYLKKFPRSQEIVPRLHGLWSDSYDTQTRFWLILEDCGEPADLNNLSIRSV